MCAREILNWLGIDELNAMQQETIQAYRRSDNLVLLSPTGSGKTLAYLLPLIEAIDSRSDRVQALVVVPSRELATQTCDVVRRMRTEVRTTAVYGGRPAMEEHRTLRGLLPHLIIGTPGRLLDHLDKENIIGIDIRTLIIDEFDKCLELGFRDEMTQLMSHLRSVEKRMLLSATDAPEITHFLPEYRRLDFLGGEKSSGHINHYVVRSPEKDKLNTLRQLLLSLGRETSLVFVGYRESVERVAKFLRREGFYATAMHGGMEQRDRERNLFLFTSGASNILVSTDLASRGLDIPALDNVIHYHLPLNEETMTHRNGRTARRDRDGRSLFILGPEETFNLQNFQNFQDFQDFDDFTTMSTGIPIPLWELLYIGKGKKDKLSRGDIAGFLMKVGGLTKEELGRIEVRDHWSFATVSRARTKSLLNHIRGQKIKGMRTIVEVVNYRIPRA